jgi:hypothetical protein
MESTSKKYSLNKVDLQKIGIGALVAISGALITYFAKVVGDVDFGVYTPIAVAVFSIIANVVRKYIADYSQE